MIQGPFSCRANGESGFCIIRTEFDAPMTVSMPCGRLPHCRIAPECVAPTNATTTKDRT
jgi:hypothetical protein